MLVFILFKNKFISLNKRFHFKKLLSNVENSLIINKLKIMLLNYILHKKTSLELKRQ